MMLRSISDTLFNLLFSMTILWAIMIKKKNNIVCSAEETESVEQASWTSGWTPGRGDRH